MPLDHRISHSASIVLVEACRYEPTMRIQHLRRPRFSSARPVEKFGMGMNGEESTAF